jgi:hypothetical protein
MSQNEGPNKHEKLLLKGSVEFSEKPADELENSQDAKAARESTKEDRQKALDLNKDQHSGSAGGHGESIEVIIRDEHGHEKVAASRQKGGSEKDIERQVANEKPVSREELQKLAADGDISASKFLARAKEAKTDEERQGIQMELDRWFGRGEFARHLKQNDESAKSSIEASKQKTDQKINTNILQAIESDTHIPEEKRQLAKHLQEMRSETKKIGGSTDAIDSFAQSELQKEIAAQEHINTPGKFDELQNQIIRAIIKQEVDDLKRGVGVVHGTVNFVVNTLAGIGNAIRMVSAATFETTPVGMLCPDLYPDKEAKEMLHKTLESTVVAGRILNQLTTTFNPTSPLFGVEYDPQGAEMTRAVVKALPEKIGHELDKFAHADPEAQTAVATEAILNIVTLIETGGIGSAAKVGEISHAGSLAKLTEETAALNEMVQVVKTASIGEKISPASTVANTAAKTLEQQAGFIAALAEKRPSLKPLADKFKECLTNFNDATKPEFAVAGGGTFKGDGVVDIIQTAGKDIKSSVEGTGKKIEDYVNRMVKKGEGESSNVRKRGNNEPSPESGEAKGNKKSDGDLGEEVRTEKEAEDGIRLSKKNHPWDVPQADIDLTNELLNGGRAESFGPAGYERLRRTDLGKPRNQFRWKAIGEVFSKDVPRQITNESCVNAVSAQLSEGRFTEAVMIKEFPPRAPMLDTANHIGGKALLVSEKEMSKVIEIECKKGPWGAKLWDGEDWHLLLVQSKNEIKGRLRIHDTYEGTKYEMDISEFKEVWTGEFMLK